MTEEDAVLDFFSKDENLPLGLSVAEQIDQIREELNNRFWLELQQHFESLLSEHAFSWKCEQTEVSNSQHNLAGLNFCPLENQSQYLKPMIEQQHLGGIWRIYFGLIWSKPPTSEQLALPEVSQLKASLQKSGFKSNEYFLGWQWTNHYPRRRDFLLRYVKHPKGLLNEVEATIKTLLIEQHELLEQTNLSLQKCNVSLSETIFQMKNRLVD